MKMELRHFSKELCKRFVDDTRLPIPAVNTADRLQYYLDLYQKDYNAMTLYENMCDEIDIDYGGDQYAFMQAFYDARKKMIDDIQENPKYKEFINYDMSVYGICDELKNIPKGDIYNATNVGKWFISVDLKKANFQAMKYFSKELVLNEDSYDGYVSRYTTSEYMVTSKHTRQIVFGQTNPGRQITIEKHLMSKLYENLSYDRECIKVVRFNNDEIVFEILNVNNCGNAFDQCNYLSSISEIFSKSVEDACSKTSIEASTTMFQLKAMCLHSLKTDKFRRLNYLLFTTNDLDMKFKSVPLVYNSIIYKLFNGMALTKDDYYFRYEGLDAYIDDDFELVVIHTAEEAIEKEKLTKKNKDDD